MSKNNYYLAAAYPAGYRGIPTYIIISTRGIATVTKIISSREQAGGTLEQDNIAVYIF